MTDDDKPTPPPQDNMIVTGSIHIESGMHANGKPGWRWGTQGMSDQELVGLLVLTSITAITKFVHSMGPPSQWEEEETPDDDT